MASINCVEINVANNAELRANAQSVVALIYAKRAVNTSKNYKLKQKEFQVNRQVLYKAVYL